MTSPESPNHRAQIDNRVLIALGLACVALLASDWLYEKHPHVQYEAWFNFYGFYGAVASVALLLIAMLWRYLLMRPEDYYDA
jgi:hypothetical protein